MIHLTYSHRTESLFEQFARDLAADRAGRSLFERLGAALFRLTGQGGKLSDWQGAFCTWLEQGGFDCQVEIIELPASRLIVISAHKKIKLE